MNSVQNKARLGFVYECEVVNAAGVVTRRGVDTNLVPQEGMNHIVALIRGTTTPIGAWFVGVFEGNYVPTSASSAAILQTGARESVSYSETARPSWNNTYDGVSVITNTAARAEYTFTANKTIYGGFLVSDATKGGSSGLLLSIARFSASYDIPLGSTFRLAVSITLLPSL